MDDIIDRVHRKSHELMSSEQFWRKLREVILLLIGLAFINVIVAIVVPLIVPDHWLYGFANYRGWIGQIAFGVVIGIRLQQQKNAISICLLSIVLPIFGGLFYLLTTTLTQTEQ
jgi:hypothetical protein